MESKYINKIFEIVKINNNSVIMKNDKDSLYRARKNEIKIVEKPIENKPLKARKIANEEYNQEKELKLLTNDKKEDPKEKIIEKRTRIIEKVDNNILDNPYAKVYNTRSRKNQ